LASKSLYDVNSIHRVVCARRQWKRALGEYYVHLTHLIDLANPGFPERCLGYAAILENGNYTSQMTA